MDARGEGVARLRRAKRLPQRYRQAEDEEECRKPGKARPEQVPAKRRKVRVRMGLSTASGTTAGTAMQHDSSDDSMRAPRVRLVLSKSAANQAESLPLRDHLLQGAVKTGASIRMPKLLSADSRSLPSGTVSELPSFTARFRSTFLVNLRSLLARHGDEVVVPGLESRVKLAEEVDGSECSITRGWRIKIKTAERSFFLRVYEDDSTCTCHQCGCLGWGRPPNCLATRKKFHFVILSSIGSSSGSTTASESSILSLHALVHCNGFGHVRQVNGQEVGSSLSGTRVMDIFDGLCVALGARMVSVQDVARKSGMHLRLTHTIASGRSWYGKWGFELARGSYGRTMDDFTDAIKGLRCARLDDCCKMLEGTTVMSSAREILCRRQRSGVTTLSQLFCLLMQELRSSRCMPERNSPDHAKCDLWKKAYADLYTISTHLVHPVTIQGGEFPDQPRYQHDLHKWAWVLLDCKFFTKDYMHPDRQLPRKAIKTGLVRIHCSLRQPMQVCSHANLTEDVFVSAAACVRDLKREATSLLRSLYPCLDAFEATHAWY
jgi:hypothetical protein